MDYTGYDMRMRITPENCFILQIIRKTDPTIALVFITIKFRYNAHTDWLKSVPSESIKHEAKAVASICLFSNCHGDNVQGFFEPQFGRIYLSILPDFWTSKVHSYAFDFTERFARFPL